jgi:hypothetical protein
MPLFAFVYFVIFLGVANGETDQERGKMLLANADRMLYPESSTYIVDLTTKYEDGKTLTWRFEGYKKGMLKQTIVMTSPDIQRNDVGIRSGEVIYWKPRKWPKPQIMSYQAAFLESPLSYGDILSVDLNEDYAVKTLKNDGPGETTLILSPKKNGFYAKLEIVIDPVTHYTKKRIFYTASGDILKTTTYSDYKTENGRVVSFTINLEHKFMKISGSAKVSNIQIESTPDFIYTPANIARIHARNK